MKAVHTPKYPLLIALQLVAIDNPIDRTVALQNLAHMLLHFHVIVRCVIGRINLQECGIQATFRNRVYEVARFLYSS